MLHPIISFVVAPIIARQGRGVNPVQVTEGDMETHGSF